MLVAHRWQSKAAFLLVLGMTSSAIAPIVISTEVIAKPQPHESKLLISQSASEVVPSGTRIPVTFDKEKIIVKPDETAKAKLIVAEDITSDTGRVVIPQGSEINGELRPADGGTQYVAKEVIIKRRNRDQRFPIKATSGVITRTETINEKTSRNVLKGAAIGAAAGAVLSEIFGDIDLGEVLAGAGVGALATVLQGKREKEVEVVVVDPERDLDLTLEEDLETDLVPTRSR